MHGEPNGSSRQPRDNGAHGDGDRARIEKALRENLRKRKSQQRQREDNQKKQEESLQNEDDTSS